MVTYVCVAEDETVLIDVRDEADCIAPNAWRAVQIGAAGIRSGKEPMTAPTSPNWKEDFGTPRSFYDR